MPLHVSSTCAHHQEVRIALHSLWYDHTFAKGEQLQVCVAHLQWLRCCATDRKVAGSIPAGVSGFFFIHHTMAVGSTQPLTKMSTRIIPWG